LYSLQENQYFATPHLQPLPYNCLNVHIVATVMVNSRRFCVKLEGALLIVHSCLAKIFIHSNTQFHLPLHLTFPKFSLNPKTQKFHLTLKSQKISQFHPQNFCYLNLLTLNLSPPKPNLSIGAQLTHSISVMFESV